MTRTEIIERFRAENPEITANVVPTVTLNSWCLQGDKEICAKARLIVSDGVITSVTGQSQYDLTNLTKFYDIDRIPGDGVNRVDTDGRYKRLDETTRSELSSNSPSWRSASNGTPKKYYRRGKYMNVWPPPDSSIEEFAIDYVAISDDFNSDAIAPYNQLTYLEPFHPGLVFYLTWRAKAKVGKAEEAATSKAAYDMYVLWMRKEIGGGKYGPIQFVPSGLPYSGNQRV
jgi:hypothetical protein